MTLSVREIASSKSVQIRTIDCSAGPSTPCVLEQHSEYSIAVVRRGAFSYSAEGRDYVLSRGSLLLCNCGQEYFCGPEYGPGDECLVFAFDRALPESIASSLGLPRSA